MSAEFKIVAENAVESTTGFMVKLQYPAGVDYRDSSGSAKIDAEWMVKPPCLLLYKNSPANGGVDDPARKEQVLSRVAAAVRFLGHKVEIE